MKFPLSYDKSNLIPNGYGALIYENGDKYEGQWSDGKIHGNGVLTTTNGSKKEGKWEYGNFSFPIKVVDGNTISYGAITYTGEMLNLLPNGEKYEGEFRLGYRHGKGNQYNSNGATYVGEWEYNKCKGFGTITTSDLSYTGEFKDNRFNGYGILILTDGTKFEGQWLDGNLKK